MCSSILAISGPTWLILSGKAATELVSLSCTVIMSNFHYGDLHSCTYIVLYLLYLLTDVELVGRRYGLFLKLTNRQLGISVKLRIGKWSDQIVVILVQHHFSCDQLVLQLPLYCKRNTEPSWYSRRCITSAKYCQILSQILRTIIKIVATRCHLLRLKCTQFRPRPGELIPLPQTP